MQTECYDKKRTENGKKVNRKVEKLNMGIYL